MAEPISFNMIRAITPSNTVNFPDGECQAIYVGATGDISVQVGGNTQVIAGIPAGSIWPVRATRVNATGTSASSLLWLKQV